MKSESSKRPSSPVPTERSAQDPHQTRRFVIDDLVRICSQTIFTPTFALLVPAVTALYTNRAGLSWDSASRLLWQSPLNLTGRLDIIRLIHESRALRWSLWYAGIVLGGCEHLFSSVLSSLRLDELCSALYSKLSYAYEQRVRPFRRPDPLKWAEQIIVITGGKL